MLAIVAEQTGYPEDLLDMDLDLEADLGIDTVKQAEMFAAIREAYGIERDDSLKLRDYPTLNHVVAFARDRAGTDELAPAAEPTTDEQEAPPAIAGAERFPRRVPVAVLRPPLEQCVETGVTLTEGTRVLVMPDGGGVALAVTAELEQRGVEVVSIEGAPLAEELEQRLAAAGPIHGVYWLPALDEDPSAHEEALRIRVKLLAVTMRALAEAQPFLVCATRLGGRHGYGNEAAISVLGGAVTGFSKALSRERPDVLVKAVDFAAGHKDVASTLIEETLRDPGAVEVGHADDLRWAVGLVERPARTDATRELTKDTVFLVTGAAGSIVSAITTDLAVASGGTFHLLDLVPAPDRDDPDLARFAHDRDGLKSELADRLRAHGERPTPKLVERDLARIERARAALDAVEAIERAGGTAHWHQLDLTKAEQVDAAVAAALEKSGRIDALIHCAGLEISHFLPDKPQAEYDLVFDVKALGWLNVISALGDSKPRHAIVFSSIAGRFGNAGQTDYSAANDLLCKSVSHLRREGVHAVAIDWTAWAGIGMASRGSIPKMMEMAGIDMLPPEIGVPIVRRELTAAGPGAEVLVAGALGVLLEERHATGGLDLDRAGAGVAGPMTGGIAGMTAGGELRIITELDPSRQAFLHDHRIEGIPVLPGVMGMEGFAEAAHVLAPGYTVVALEDVDLLAPFKFYRDERRTLELRALVRDGGDATLVADCELVGRRALPGQGEQETLHFTGRALMAREAPAAPPAESPPTDGDDGVGHDAVYRVYFHGPAYQVLDRAWRDNGHVIGRLAGELPVDHEPQSTPTEFVPRLIELCFQTAGVWELGTAGRMALPTHVDRVVRYAGADAPGRLWAVVTPRDGGCVDAEVVDEHARVRVRLDGYRTTELPGGLDDDALAPIRTAMGHK